MSVNKVSVLVIWLDSMLTVKIWTMLNRTFVLCGTQTKWLSSYDAAWLVLPQMVSCILFFVVFWGGCLFVCFNLLWVFCFFVDNLKTLILILKNAVVISLSSKRKFCSFRCLYPAQCQRSASSVQRTWRRVSQSRLLWSTTLALLVQGPTSNFTTR